VQDREAVDLLDDVADVERGGRRAAMLHLRTEHAKIVRRHLRQQAVLPGWQDVAIEDRLTHGARAVRHACLLEPAFARAGDGRGRLSSTARPLLFLRGALAGRNRLARSEAPLAGFGERQAGGAVDAERQCLAPAIDAVVVAETDSARRHHRDVHTVTVSHLVGFLLRFQPPDRDVGQHHRVL
jgi:hypothetical protein